MYQLTVEFRGAAVSPRIRSIIGESRNTHELMGCRLGLEWLVGGVQESQQQGGVSSLKVCFTVLHVGA